MTGNIKNNNNNNNDNNKLIKERHMMLATSFVLAIIAVSPVMTPAFAHSHLTLFPEQEHANPIEVVIGHTNEPSFGAKEGFHDGKHFVDFFLSDFNTGLPIADANLTVNKYYFENVEAFNNATSLEDATAIEKNVTLSGVFGDPGHYNARQIVSDGVYGYNIVGTIDYFGVAEVPINVTSFCTPRGEGVEGSVNSTKFDSDGWHGSYGCIQELDSLFFPEQMNLQEKGEQNNKTSMS